MHSTGLASALLTAAILASELTAHGSAAVLASTRPSAPELTTLPATTVLLTAAVLLAAALLTAAILAALLTTTVLTSTLLASAILAAARLTARAFTAILTFAAVAAFLSVIVAIPALSSILARRWLAIGALVAIAFFFPAAISLFTFPAFPASTLPLLALLARTTLGGFILLIVFVPIRHINPFLCFLT